MRLSKPVLLVLLIVVLSIVVITAEELKVRDNSLSIAYIDFDTNTDEIVVLLNSSTEQIDLTGYCLSSGGGQNFTFRKSLLNPQMPLIEPYDVVRIHSGDCCTSDDPRDYRWDNKDGSCRTACVWNDEADIARLYAKDGEVLDEYHYSSFPEASVMVHFLNTGQSDAIYLESTDGFNALIDSGDWQQHGAILIDYFEQHQITKLQVLVASHQEADHIGGHPEVMEYFMTRGGIGEIWDTGLAGSSMTAERYLDAVEQYSDRLDIVFPVASDRYEWGRYLSIEVLNPPKGYLANGDRNENSIVLHVVFNNIISFLFPGDAGPQAELLMLSQGYPLSSTVLKVAHHGSYSATTEPFLDAVNPQIAIITAPLHSQYDHPHTQTLDKLCQRAIVTYWTGIHGNIKLSVDGQGTVSISVEQRNTTDACEMANLRE